MNKKKLVKIVLAVLVVISIIIGLLSCSNRTTVLEIDPVIIELGTELTPDMLGLEITEDEFTINDELVDYTQVGTYEAVVIYEEYENPFTVIIEDTTAPELTAIEQGTSYPVNTEIALEDLVEVFDLSEVVLTVRDTSYDVEEKEGYLLFTEKGIYENTIIATDASGNESELEVTLEIGIAPIISGIENLTILIESEFDFLDGVTAVDPDGIDITDRIEADYSEVNLEETGTYTATYTVTDDDGNITTCTRIITVVLNLEEVTSEESNSSNSSSSSNASNSSSSSNASNSSSSNNASNSSSSSNASNSSSSSNSSTSGSSSTSSNASNSSGSNTSTHTCSYTTPIYKTIEEVGHYETVVVKEAWTEIVTTQEKQARSICNTCGEDITGNTTAHTKVHTLAGEGGSYSVIYVYVDVETEVEHDAVTEKVYVIDTPASQTIIGYSCSCGKEKYN